MKAIAISFSLTIRDLHEKKLALIDIDEFHVGCQREHLFPMDQLLVPMEVSWLNEKLEHQYGAGSISQTLVDPEAMWTWENLREWLAKLDAEGKVKYQIGNYPDAVRRLLVEGHRVWYWGRWADLSDYSPAELEKLRKEMEYERLNAEFAQKARTFLSTLPAGQWIPYGVWSAITGGDGKFTLRRVLWDGRKDYRDDLTVDEAVTEIQNYAQFELMRK